MASRVAAAAAATARAATLLTHRLPQQLLRTGSKHTQPHAAGKAARQAALNHRRLWLAAKLGSQQNAANSTASSSTHSAANKGRFSSTVHTHVQFRSHRQRHHHHHHHGYHRHQQFIRHMSVQAAAADEDESPYANLSAREAPVPGHDATASAAAASPSKLEPKLAPSLPERRVGETVTLAAKVHKVTRPKQAQGSSLITLLVPKYGVSRQ